MQIKSEQCLKAHRKTQIHTFWEQTNQQKKINIDWKLKMAIFGGLMLEQKV